MDVTLNGETYPPPPKVAQGHRLEQTEEGVRKYPTVSHWTPTYKLIRAMSCHSLPTRHGHKNVAALLFECEKTFQGGGGSME